MEPSSNSKSVFWYDYKSNKTFLDGKSYTRPLTAEEKGTYDQLHAFTIEAMLEITQGHQTLEQSDSQMDLLKGIRYGNPYFLKLKKLAPSSPLAKKTLETFIQKGHFYHGYVPVSHFDFVADKNTPGGIRGYDFTMKAGKLPCEALDKVKSGLSLIDCGMTIQLAHYTALRSLWGDEKFNHVFRYGSKFAFKVCSDAHDHPSRFYNSYRLFARPLTLKDMEIGQIYHVQNVSQYPRKHTEAESAGFFLCCISNEGGEPKLTGLGFPSTGVTLRQVEEYLINEFNSDPIDATEMYPPEIPTGSLLTKFMSAYMPKITNIDDFHKDQGGLLPVKIDLDPILAHDISKAATLPEVDRILDIATQNINAFCNHPKIDGPRARKEMSTKFGAIFPKLLNGVLNSK